MRRFRTRTLCEGDRQGDWTAFERMDYVDHEADVDGMDCRNEGELEEVKRQAEEWNCSGFSVCKGIAMLKRPQKPIQADQLQETEINNIFYVYTPQTGQEGPSATGAVPDAQDDAAGEVDNL